MKEMPRDVFKARLLAMEDAMFDQNELGRLTPAELSDYKNFLYKHREKAHIELVRSGYHP